jgi:hypothetical protein
MSRKTDLEGSIRDSYGIIREYERQIQFEDRPEVKMRARRSIDQQWAHIEGYWDEYRILAGDGIPEDIVQITARFAQPDFQPVDVPTHGASTHGSTRLTIEERRQLVRIIARRPEFGQGSGRSRSVFLTLAGLERFLSVIALAGPSQTVAADLVSRLENYGVLPDRPGYHALGALLSYLALLDDLPREDARFVEDLILRYGLVKGDDDSR